MTWEMQEPGWYTSDIGGIIREYPGKWLFWPKDQSERPIGPWTTFAAAKVQAEVLAKTQRT